MCVLKPEDRVADLHAMHHYGGTALPFYNIATLRLKKANKLIFYRKKNHSS